MMTRIMGYIISLKLRFKNFKAFYTGCSTLLSLFCLTRLISCDLFITVVSSTELPVDYILHMLMCILCRRPVAWGDIILMEKAGFAGGKRLVSNNSLFFSFANVLFDDHKEQ